MMSYIKNKTVLVTGGADGIGFSIAKKYLENGAKVAILIDIDEKKGVQAEKLLKNRNGECRAEFIQCDVTKDLETTYNTIMDKYKYVDVLVNSAGIGDRSIPRRLIEINATAVIEWSLKFFKLMNKEKEGKGGTIINIASVLGYQIAPFAHVYQASKFAVTGFTRSIGHKRLYPRTGVRTITLCPGLTDTNMFQQMTLKEPENEFAAKVFNNAHMGVQNVDAVAEAAIEILDKAESGSMWSIVDGELQKVDVEIKLNLSNETVTKNSD